MACLTYGFILLGMDGSHICNWFIIPVTVGEAPVTVCEAPASLGEALVTVGEAPASLGEAPVTTREALHLLFSFAMLFTKAV
jgi:hypothetical protein